MPETIQAAVDKAGLLEVGRVFKRAYRRDAANVILTLGNGHLKIAFHGGGCDLPCDTTESLVAELTAKAFAGIVSAYRKEKSPAGTLILTFRPELGEFSTPLAGAKAKFHLSSNTTN